MNTLRGILFFIASAACARAQFTLSITATANATASGYTSGQTVVFNFNVTGANLSANNGNQFFSYTNQWWYDVTGDAPLFTSVSGTGLTGTYSQPSANSNDPFSYIQAAPDGPPSLLTFDVGAETSNLGLIVNGHAVTEITVGNLDWGQSFPAPATYTALTTYFTPFAGSHSLVGGYMDMSLSGASQLHFTPSNLTISAVPEPSACALMLGAAGLAAAGWLRRRRGA